MKSWENNQEEQNKLPTEMKKKKKKGILQYEITTKRAYK